MDALKALEDGLLPLSPLVELGSAIQSAEVAHRWAESLGLRPGNTLGPPPSALVPVVDVWAVAHGWTGPACRELGRGLLWAGLRRRSAGPHGCNRLVLHREDSAKLWRLARAAWAPVHPPGDPRRYAKRKQKRRGRRVRPHPPPPREDFHATLAQLPTPNRRPLADSLGRVWPSPAVAARGMGGNPKALGNSMAWLREALEGGRATDSHALQQAIKRGAKWKGLLWRYLTPGEVAAIPQGILCGSPVPGLGWGLTCQKCSANPTHP